MPENDLSKAAAKGEVEAVKSQANKESVTYTGCTAFGFFEAKVSEAKYKFEIFAASKVEPFQGAVEVEKPNIIIELPAAGCKVTVSQAGNGKLEKAEYVNKGAKEIEEKTNVEKIHYTPSGGQCGENKEKEDGKYTGNEAIKINGGAGSIQVK